MEKVIGIYTVGLKDTLITIKDNEGNLLKGNAVQACNAVEKWKENCEMVSKAIKNRKVKG